MITPIRFSQSRNLRLRVFWQVPIDQTELAGQADGFRRDIVSAPKIVAASIVGPVQDWQREIRQCLLRASSAKSAWLDPSARYPSRTSMAETVQPSRASDSREAGRLPLADPAAVHVATCSSVGKARIEPPAAMVGTLPRTTPRRSGTVLAAGSLPLEAAPIAALDARSGFGAEFSSPALRIPTIQTSRTPIHQDDRIRIALGAHGGAGWEGGGIGSGRRNRG